jgi:aryl-alcohol dehydrogenase-like predicted oxidoreductase
MKKKSLNTKLAIGTAQFSTEKYGISSRGQEVKLSEFESILNLAYSQNVDTIDTAKNYKGVENKLGLIHNRQKDIPYKIITKLNNDRINIIEQLNDSIKTLKTKPYAVLAHNSSLYLKKSFQNDLLEIKKKKLVKKVGVSIYNPAEAEAVLKADLKPDLIQLPINILDTKFYRKNILEKLKFNNVEIHARSIFLQGLFFLSDKKIKNLFPDVINSIKELKSIALEGNLSIFELSLLWVINLKYINKVVLGIESVQQLKVHLNTLRKKVDFKLFEDAISLKYENEQILNPSLWA